MILNQNVVVFSDELNEIFTFYTLKTSGSNATREGSWGQTTFRINDDPEISQPDTEYDPELRQCDLTDWLIQL